MTKQQNLKGICEKIKIKTRNNKPPPLHKKYDQTWPDISITNRAIIVWGQHSTHDTRITPVIRYKHNRR